MSERGDEIDWETVGKDAQSIQTNIFYKGIIERGVHGGVHKVADISKPHEYELDWKRTGLTFAIDGVVVRNVTPTSENRVSKMVPVGENWYPTTASLVQVSIWDSPSTDWSGGPINWNSLDAVSASFEWVKVQCYDENDRPVGAFPADAGVPPPAPTQNATAGTVPPKLDEKGKTKGGSSSGVNSGAGVVGKSVVGIVAAALGVVAWAL